MDREEFIVKAKKYNFTDAEIKEIFSLLDDDELADFNFSSECALTEDEVSVLGQIP